MAGTVALYWNGTDGACVYGAKFSLLRTKPVLGFPFDTLVYSAGDYSRRTLLGVVYPLSVAEAALCSTYAQTTSDTLNAPVGVIGEQLLSLQGDVAALEVSTATNTSDIGSSRITVLADGVEVPERILDFRNVEVQALTGTAKLVPESIGVSEPVTPGDILVYDAATRKVVPSSLRTDNEGTLVAGPGTIVLGEAHAVSSAVQDVVFRNIMTGKEYYPVWIDGSESGDGLPYARMWAAPKVTNSVLMATDTDTLLNPDYMFTPTVSARLFGMQLKLVAPSAFITVTVYEGTHLAWRIHLRDTPAGLVDINFANSPYTQQHPGSTLTYKSGLQYRFVFSGVTLLGDSVSGIPWQTITYREFIDRDLYIDKATVPSTSMTATVDAGVRNLNLVNLNGVPSHLDVGAWFDTRNTRTAVYQNKFFVNTGGGVYAMSQNISADIGSPFVRVALFSLAAGSTTQWVFREISTSATIACDGTDLIITTNNSGTGGAGPYTLMVIGQAKV